MYKNIGKKIKVLAVVVCILGILISIGAAIGLFITADNVWDGEELFIAGGIAALVIGPVISWLLSFFTYGFGELVDKAASIDSKLVPNGTTAAPVQRPAAPAYVPGTVNAPAAPVNRAPAAPAPAPVNFAKPAQPPVQNSAPFTPAAPVKPAAPVTASAPASPFTPAAPAAPAAPVKYPEKAEKLYGFLTAGSITKEQYFAALKNMNASGQLTDDEFKAAVNRAANL